MRALLLLALGACTPPDMNEAFNQVSLSVTDNAQATNQPYIDLIDSAERTLHVALPNGDDPAAAAAIIDAWDRGVDVEVITDIDLADTPAVQQLLDAGVPTALADDGIAYFDFNLNQDVAFASEDCIMSHSYAIADRQRIVMGNAWGRLGDARSVVFELRGERIIEDLGWEHRQVFAGTDATATTAFDAPAKSITNPRFFYPTTNDLMLEMWFGPQERLLKRVIDAVYSARVSVRILTDEAFNDGLFTAMQDKASRGMPVTIVTGPSFDPTNADIRPLFAAAPDVLWNRSPASGMPTIILIDLEDDERGFRSRARAMVLTHDLISSNRLYRRNPIKSDQLIDGTMLSFIDTNEPSAELVALLDLFRDYLADAEAL